MEKLKEILKKLFRLHISLLIILSAASTALLLYAFCYPEPIGAVCYFSYLISAYSLTAVCFRIPDMLRVLRAFSEKNRAVALYKSDVVIRLKISLYISTAINLAYAIMQLYLGFANRSIWFYALAAYYALLTAIRLLFLRHTRRNRPGTALKDEFIRCGICGILLGAMNIALGIVVFYIVRQNRGFEYGEIATISMAAYTFLTLTLSIVGLIRYRKYESPIMSASKAISLAAAAVSVLSLETAMISAFGQDESPFFRRSITASTGGVVCVFVLTMAVFMVVRSVKEISKTKERFGNGKEKIQSP